MSRKKCFGVCLVLVAAIAAVIAWMFSSGKADVTGGIRKHVLELSPTEKVEFVECPAGSFMMGYDPNPSSPYRKHKVTITRPFWLATTKLTVGQWKTWEKDYAPPEEILALGGDKVPVMEFRWGRACVFREHFDAFCRHLTERFKDRIPEGYVFRQATEAEWEYAYSANNLDPKSFYSSFSRTESTHGFTENDIKLFIENKGVSVKGNRKFALAVGQFPPNPWGLYDMAGNMSERTLDTTSMKVEKLRYDMEETDPLRCITISDRDWADICRGGDMGNKEKGKWGKTYRLCVGPDLMKEKHGKLLAEVERRMKKSLEGVKRHELEFAPGVKVGFVECPAGTFMMGYDKDPKSPCRRHKVTITKPFWLAATKLTVGQFRTWKKDYNPPKGALALGGENIPALASMLNFSKERIDWKSLEEFCRHLTKRFKNEIPKGYVFRLPTEAEWEYAYSANVTVPFSPFAKFERTHSRYGFCRDDLNRMAMLNGAPVEWREWKRSGAAVGQYPPNPWGLYDMVGNTIECMQDTVDREKCASNDRFDQRKGQTALLYKDHETDPVRVAPATAKEICCIGRGGELGNRDKKQGGLSYRLCIGPDLVKEHAEKQLAKKR